MSFLVAASYQIIFDHVRRQHLGAVAHSGNTGMLWFNIGIGWELLEWGGGKMLSAAGRDNLIRSRDNQTQYGDVIQRLTSEHCRVHKIFSGDSPVYGY